MPDDKDPKDPDQGGDDELDARITRVLDAKLNAAMTSRDKRLMGGFEKLLTDKLSALNAAREDKPAADPKPAEGAAAKADPEVLKLREQLDKLTRQADEDRKARASVEEKSRRETARAAIREALSAKGITGARARAVIADLEASGAVRFTEDGVPELVVKRARMKGGRAEELAFDDIAAGIEDWAKSDDAKEFLPASTTAIATTPRRAGANPTPALARGTAAATHNRSMSDDERADSVARQLEAAGVDAASLFD